MGKTERCAKSVFGLIDCDNLVEGSFQDTLRGSKSYSALERPPSTTLTIGKLLWIILSRYYVWSRSLVDYGLSFIISTAAALHVVITFINPASTRSMTPGSMRLIQSTATSCVWYGFQISSWIWRLNQREASVMKKENGPEHGWTNGRRTKVQKWSAIDLVETKNSIAFSKCFSVISLCQNNLDKRQGYMSRSTTSPPVKRSLTQDGLMFKVKRPKM